MHLRVSLWVHTYILYIYWELYYELRFIQLYKVFDSEQKLNDNVKRNNIKTLHGITNFTVEHFNDHNIGQGLFDTLYPSIY